jgi:hypothetical protein
MRILEASNPRQTKGILLGSALENFRPKYPCLLAVGLAALDSTGCHTKSNSLFFPVARGTYGNATRDIFRDSRFRNWDLSLTKG